MILAAVSDIGVTGAIAAVVITVVLFVFAVAMAEI